MSEHEYIIWLKYGDCWLDDATRLRIIDAYVYNY